MAHQPSPKLRKIRDKVLFAVSIVISLALFGYWFYLMVNTPIERPWWP